MADYGNDEQATTAKKQAKAKTQTKKEAFFMSLERLGSYLHLQKVMCAARLKESTYHEVSKH